MRNIYNQKKEEQRLYILDVNIPYQTDSMSKKVAVVINLYYRDTLSYYMGYIECIPEEISVYVCSSDVFVLEQVKNKVQRNNLLCILKENRGRDISAFLVAAKDVIRETEIFCFIHDKRANEDHLKEDAEVWIKNLWNNTLASESYIREVLNLFEGKKDMGLLVPPEPYGEFYTHWYGNTWGEDYMLTCDLAKRIDLCEDIRRDVMVSTLGTVFWARTAALKKLLDYPWRYEDFPPEPLPIDGTISHAIERVLGFVAQDAGYKTATIMTKEYASSLLLRTQEDMRIMFGQLRKREHVHNLYQIKNLDAWEQELKCFCEKHNKIYIYGAGDYGKSIVEFMKDQGLLVDGFVVSPGKRKDSEVNGLPVLEINELSDAKEIGYIIGVSYESRSEIEDMLKKNDIKNYMNGF